MDDVFGKSRECGGNEDNGRKRRYKGSKGRTR